MKKKLIYTIGHSTRSTREFMSILKSFEIEMLIDIRHYPGSRYCPQFGKARLKASLKRNKIDYLHLEVLGGRRSTKKNSDENSAWRNKAFRGYADYMQTPEFIEGLEELMELATHKNVGIMCAEAVPWRCHRSLVGDALIIRKWDVQDIFDLKKSKPHKITPFAKVKGKKITYPEE